MLRRISAAFFSLVLLSLVTTATAALVLALVVGSHTAADVVLALFIPAAGLESIAGYCLGCKVFGLLMRAGLVPADVCAECADISGRLRAAASSPR